MRELVRVLLLIVSWALINSVVDYELFTKDWVLLLLAVMLAVMLAGLSGCIRSEKDE